MKFCIKIFACVSIFVISGFSVHASQGCLVSRSVLTGELQEVITRDIKRNDIVKYHIVLPKLRCVKLSGKTQKLIKHVKHIQIQVINSKPEELKEFVGLKISLRGDHKRSSSKAADVHVVNARLLGAYDPRNGRFHHWSELQKKVVKLKKQQKEAPIQEEKKENNKRFAEVVPQKENGRIGSEDKDRLKEIIERGDDNSRDDDRVRYRDNIFTDSDETFRFERRTIKNVDHRLYDDVFSFVNDEYLQFHQMHPEEVTLFYAPVIEFNGDRSVLSEIAIRRKFINYRKFPDMQLRLVAKSLRIEERSGQEDVYDVSFVYKVKNHDYNGRRWLKKRAELTLDLNMDDVQIRKEKVHIFDRPYS